MITKSTGTLSVSGYSQNMSNPEKEKDFDCRAAYDRGYREGVAAERERIKAGLDAMPTVCVDEVASVDVDQFLAVIDKNPAELETRIAEAIKAEQSTLSGMWEATPGQMARAVIAALTADGKEKSND